MNASRQASGTTVPRKRTLEPLTIAGLMSGTSADGIDVAIVRIEPAGPGKRARTDASEPKAALAPPLHLELLLHRSFPFGKPLREAVLAAQDAQRTSTAELARLHWRLGLAYAQAFCKARQSYGSPVDLVGCHGQTVYHQGQPAAYAGARFRCTWQIGEMALLAAEAGVPVYSNFRPADMVAGGQGAPLVPLLDQTLYRHPKHTRVLQNIGGIGNLTVVPPFGGSAPTFAFDTGPGNMVMDALTRQLFDKPFDRGGRIAARGQVLEAVVASLLKQPFFRQVPPRSAGREQFGAAFTQSFLQACRRQSRAPEDILATATALTAASIALALQRFVLAGESIRNVELILSGGGAHNKTLLEMIEARLPAGQVRLLTTADPSLPTSLPVESKEAVAFALLAYMGHHGLAGNIPAATGASASVILGQVTCA